MSTVIQRGHSLVLNLAAFERQSQLRALLVAGAAALAVGLFMARTDYDWQGLALLIPVAGFIALFLLPRMARLEAGSFFFRILMAGFVLKMAFCMVKVLFGFGVYGGSADWIGYHRSGTAVAEYIWRFDFGPVVSLLQFGTDFLEFFTGVVYALIGPTLYGGHLFYGVLAFLGSYFYYKAFRVAFPQGNRRLYAVLIFLFPSILYWANGITKDALMLLAIGLSAYGSALLLRQRLWGLAPLLAGLAGTLWIRPHIAAMLALALAAALLPGFGGKRKAASVLSYVLRFAVVVGLIYFVLPRALTFLGLEQLSYDSLMEYMKLRQAQTFTGGSAFQTYGILEPLGFPFALMTLLFRPFPWEAHNLQALVQAMEGVLVMGLVLWRIKSIGRGLAASVSDPFSRFGLLYMVAFTIAFSTVGNFGIVVRERDMFLPFLFMLVAYGASDARNDDTKRKVTAS